MIVQQLRVARGSLCEFGIRSAHTFDSFAEYHEHIKECLLPYISQGMRIEFELYPHDLRDGVDPETATLADIRNTSKIAQYGSVVFLIWFTDDHKQRHIRVLKYR